MLKFFGFSQEAESPIAAFRKCMHQAEKNVDYDVLKELLTPEFVERLSIEERMLVLEYCYESLLPCLSYVLQKQILGRYLDQPTSTGNTPLMVAVQTHNESLAAFLLLKGASYEGRLSKKTFTSYQAVKDLDNEIARWLEMEILPKKQDLNKCQTSLNLIESENPNDPKILSVIWEMISIYKTYYRSLYDRRCTPDSRAGDEGMKNSLLGLAYEANYQIYECLRKGFAVCKAQSTPTAYILKQEQDILAALVDLLLPLPSLFLHYPKLRSVCWPSVNRLNQLVQQYSTAASEAEKIYQAIKNDSDDSDDSDIFSTLNEEDNKLPSLFTTKNTQSLIESVIGGVEHLNLHQRSADTSSYALDGLKKTLLTRYKSRDKIPALFGKPFKLKDQYIHVQMLYQAQVERESAIKHDQSQSNTLDQNTISHALSDTRISSFEDLFSLKIPLEIHKLFAPANTFLKEDQKTPERDSTKSPNTLLVMGRAGIGKTTFVDYVAREWARKRLWQDYQWVFVLRFRDLRSSVFAKASEQGRTYTLAEWIYHTFYSGNLDFTDFKEMWKHHIEPNLSQCLFILDGYDEIPSFDQHPCAAALQYLLESSNSLKLITSRPYGLEGLPLKRREVEIMGFTDENIKKYCDFYFGETQQSKSKKIIEALKSHNLLWGSAHIPVTLNILCGIVDGAKSEFSLQRTLQDLGVMSGLYQRMELALLERSYYSDPKNKDAYSQLQLLSYEEKAFLLYQHYAQERQLLVQIGRDGFSQQQIVLSKDLVIHSLDAAHIAPHERHIFLKRLLAQGLLRPILGENPSNIDPIGYEFLHLTFQEYYAAQGMIKTFEVGDLKQIASLETIKFDPRYQFVWCFISGALKNNTEAWLRLMHFLQDNNLSQDLSGQYKLALLVRCIDEAFEIAEIEGTYKTVCKEIQSVLFGWFKLHQENLLPNNFSSPLLISLKLSSRWLNPSHQDQDIFHDLLVDSKLKDQVIIRFMSHINLVNNRGLDRLTQFLNNKNFAVVLYTIENRLNNTDVAAAENVLRALGAAAATPQILRNIAQLLGDKNPIIRTNAVSLVKAIGEAAATPEFLQRLVQLLTNIDWRIQKTAVDVVLSLGKAVATPEFLHGLSGLLIDSRKQISTNILSVLSHLGEAAATLEVLARLMPLLHDSNKEVRKSAVSALGQLGALVATPEVLSALLVLFRHEDSKVRKSAVSALGQLGAAAATSEVLRILLLALCSDADSEIRRSAVSAIGKFGAAGATFEVLSMLLVLFWDVNSEIRKSAVSVVGQLGGAAATPEVLSALLVLFSDPDSKVRRSAISVVGQLGAAAATPEVLSALLVLFRDVDSKVRSRAAYAVGQLGAAATTTEVLHALIRLLADVDGTVRSNAAHAVGSLGAVAAMPEVLNALISLLSDADWRVRRSAANTVGQSGPAGATPEVLNALISLLSDADREVRKSAAFAVGKLGALAATPEVLNALISLLSDADREVRKSATYAVGQLGASVATPEFLRALISHLGDADSHVQNNAAFAVGKLGASAATPEVLRALIPLFSYSNNSHVRNNAAFAVGQLGAAAATLEVLSALIFQLKSNDADREVRMQVVKSLHQLMLEYCVAMQREKTVIISDITCDITCEVLLIGVCLRGDVQLGLSWNAKVEHYELKGLINKQLIQIQLSLKEAQHIRHLMPKVIERLQQADILGACSLFKNPQFPDPKQDILLPEYLSTMKHKYTPYNHLSQSFNFFTERSHYSETTQSQVDTTNANTSPTP